MPTEEWLTPQELSAWLKIPLQTIYNWRVRGGGPPATKIGRHLRYRRTDLERWIESRKSPTQPASEAAKIEVAAMLRLGTERSAIKRRRAPKRPRCA